MGQDQSKYSVLNTPEFLSQWELEKSIGYCELMENKKSGEQIQKYKLMKEQVNINDQLEFYEYRKNQNSHLVRVLYIEEQKKTGICTGENFYNVYTQRIPLRLSEIQNLSFEQSLLTIRDALTGFQILKDSYEGCLKISDEMIGFTVDGKVKIWMNQNFYLNSPQQHTLLKGVTYQNDPTVIVAQIFHTIQQHLQNKSFPEEFTKKLQSQQTRLDYQRAKTFIRNYCIHNDLKLPERLNIRNYISQFKRQSLKITLPAVQLKEIVNTRKIKIIPEASNISPKKNCDRVLIPNNINTEFHKQKVNLRCNQPQSNINIQNNPEHIVFKKPNQIVTQQPIYQNKRFQAMLNSNQIQRINSQYIYYQQPSQTLTPNISRKKLQPLNILYQHAVKSTRPSQLNEQAQSLNDKLDRLTISIQQQIQKNSLSQSRMSKITYKNYSIQH